MRTYVPINGNKAFDNLAREHPDRLGHIISPSYYQKPKKGIPFILDNDAFGCWRDKKPFDSKAWITMLKRVEDTGLEPEWVIIPDVVCDKDATLSSWWFYRQFTSWSRAFVLQDGITLEELPDADIYFLGGSTDFKWSTARYWCEKLPRVHIGRVRSMKIHFCERIGAESCDGSGWLREGTTGRPFKQLEAWAKKLNHQHYLDFTPLVPVEKI